MRERKRERERKRGMGEGEETREKDFKTLMKIWRSLMKRHIIVSG